jgi:hypothetical protein
MWHNLTKLTPGTCHDPPVTQVKKVFIFYFENNHLFIPINLAFFGTAILWKRPKQVG